MRPPKSSHGTRVGLAERHGHDDDVGPGDEVGGRDDAGAGGDHRHEQVERGLPRRARHEHVVAGCHEESGEGGAHLPRTEDPDDRPVRHVHASILADARDRCVDIIRQRTEHRAHSLAVGAEASARPLVSAAVRGIVSASRGLRRACVRMETRGWGRTMAERYEFGLDTFGDVTAGPDGSPLPHAQVLRNVVEEAVLADRLGLDFFGIGEHHRHEFAVSAPEVVLGAIAGRTERIHLGSAVTVLSSDDPVRVFQRFATLDGLSGGRAEVILGRGSFIESFPLFGFELNQYQELFEEKLNLFAALLPQEPVTWSGELRAAADRPARLPARRARTPEDLGRRRRQPRVRRPRGALRTPARARDHRRQPGAVRPARRPLPSRARAVRQPAAAGRDPLARLHRRHRRGGARHALAALQGHHRPHRPRARLGAGHPRALRGRGRAERRALRGIARDRRAEDRRGHAHRSARCGST